MAKLGKKPLLAVIAATSAIVIALAGTFAWNAINQSRTGTRVILVAPDVNLHDDFAVGTNKDIYAENSGAKNIYLRIRLTEFLQTEQRGSLVEESKIGSENTHLWAPHNSAGGAADLCAPIPPGKISKTWEGEGFHDYYRWQMGGNAGNPTGQIYYLPATAEQKGKYNPDGTVVREPVSVCDPLTGTSPQKNAHLAYTDSVNALLATGETEENAMKTLGIRKTKTASVITMTQWIEGDAPNRPPYAMGDFWVIDEADGWCYWANALPGEQATGLLLDAVERTDREVDSTADYGINAMLQATDENELDKFEMADAGGITENGKKLLQLAAGKIIVTDSGAYTPKTLEAGTNVAATDYPALIVRFSDAVKPG